MTATLPPELATATPVELAIAKLELRPGDVLVIQPGFRVDNDTARRIVEWAKGVLPEGTKCMVVAPGTDLTVIRRESANADEPAFIRCADCTSPIACSGRKWCGIGSHVTA